MSYKFFLFFSFFIFKSFYSSEQWDVKNFPPTYYFFSPGLFADENQLEKYCSNFKDSHLKANSSSFVDVIGTPVFFCDFEQRIIRKNSEGYFRSINPAYLIKNSLKQAVYFFTTYFHSALNFSLQSKLNFRRFLVGKWYDLSKISFGQESDIEIFKRSYQKALFEIKDINNQSHVLYGITRGAATIFNFVAIENPKNIKALICEGIFDSFQNLIQYRFPYSSLIVLKFLEAITNFDSQKISPAMNVLKIPKDLPILLIASFKDKIVPCQCSINLYKELIKTGHHNVHLLLLDTVYPRSFFATEEDINLYQDIVHAFYKKYNLPHIQKSADRGQKYFEEKTQPNF